MRASAIVVAAGQGERFGLPKTTLPLMGQPLVFWAVRPLWAAGLDVVVAVRPDDLTLVANALASFRDRVQVVAGGSTRSESVRSGLAALGPDADRVLVHDGARPLLTEALVHRLLAAKGDVVIPVLSVADTVRAQIGPGSGDYRLVPREGLWQVQTPQAFDRRVLERAHVGAGEAPDDAELALQVGAKIETVQGERGNLKITWPEDLELARRWSSAGPARVGHGYDIHRLAVGTGVRLGGITIESNLTLVGHSDADVVLHAVMDAMLGAAGLAEDIGVLFPPGEPTTRGIDSGELLAKVRAHVNGQGFVLTGCDISIIAERPRIAPERVRMRARLSQLLGLPETQLGLKATTNEGVGTLGRSEAIAAFAVVTLASMEAAGLI